MTRQEYLQRPLIEGVVYKINADEIRIGNDCTVFIQTRNCRKITLQEVQAHFRQLQQEAKASGKVRLKGSTKFMPAVKKLYPAYYAACDRIEKLFTELTELIRQVQQDGIHMCCVDDELLKAAERKENEITEHYYRNSDYSRFLDYDNRVCDALRNRPWENKEIIAITLTIA